MSARALVLLPLLLGPFIAAGPARAGARELRQALDQARAAVSSGDAGALDRALRAAMAEDGKRAIPELLELALAVPAERQPLYWQVVGAVASAADDKALDALGDFLVTRGDQPQAGDLLFALQNNRAPGVLAVYRRILAARRSPLKELAVDRLGELGRPEAVDLLLEVWEDEQGSGSDLERRVRATLTGLFGEDMGDFANYRGYWEANRATALSKHQGGGGTGTVKDELDAARKGGLTSMSRRGGKVLVLTGTVRNFDQIEQMLERLGVPHRAMPKPEFMADMDRALDGVAALILNCNFFGSLCKCPTCKPGQDPNSRLPVCTGCDRHDVTTDRLTEAAIERIRAFVAAGGSVFTEDWGLKELTARAWPEHVGVGPDLPEQEVDYSPVRGQSGSPLLRGVFSRPGAQAGTLTRIEARWKVDNLSPSIRVVDASRVTVLLASQTLRQGGADREAVAVSFSPGEATGATTVRQPERERGRSRSSRSRGESAPAARPGIVLHVLSHFGKQKSKDDEFTLQNMLVNFLLEAQERHAAARAAR